MQFLEALAANVYQIYHKDHTVPEARPPPLVYGRAAFWVFVSATGIRCLRTVIRCQFELLRFRRRVTKFVISGALTRFEGDFLVKGSRVAKNPGAQAGVGPR